MTTGTVKVRLPYLPVPGYFHRYWLLGNTCFFFSFPLIWTLVISFSSFRLIFILSWFHWSITEELKQRKYEQRRVLGAHDYYWLDQTTHPSLRHLDLSDCPHLSAEGLRQILDLFPGVVQLVPVVSWRGNICGLKKWAVRTGSTCSLFLFVLFARKNMPKYFANSNPDPIEIQKYYNLNGNI